MHEAPTTISLPAVFALLRRNLWIIFLVVALAVTASIALSVQQESRYEAAATIGFNDSSADLQALGVPASPDFQPDKEAAAQSERITHPEIVGEVRRSLDLRTPIADLQDAITTQVESSSNLVTITAEADSAFLSSQLANAFANAIEDDATERAVERYEAAAREARRRASRLKGVQNAARRAVFEDQSARLLALAGFARPVEIVRAAQTPDGPSSPKPVRNAILAGLLGGMLGLGIAFLRQAFDRRLREQADVEHHVDAPIVGAVRTSTLGTSPLVTGKGRTREEEVEAFRILRPNVGLLDGENGGGGREGGPKVILVTSPLPAEGKSTVAAGLAWADAMTGRRTLLVDCDLRRPTVAERLGIERSPGLSDFLSGDCGPGETLRSVSTGERSDREAPQLVVIPAGRQVPDHAELLESKRFGEFIAQVGEVYDRIILDSAPLLPVSDTLHLIPHVDAVLLCLRLGQTTRDDAHAASTALSRHPDTPVGVVLTAADKSQSPYYAGGYSYNEPAATR